MVEEVTSPRYAAVMCRACREPIPVPAIVTQTDRLIGHSNQESHQQERVFHLRCRACSAERLYQSSQIVEVEGQPRPKTRVSGVGLVARAANA